MVMKKKVSFFTPKPEQMMIINVKVNVKVTNGTFSKKNEHKIVIWSYFGTKFCNVSRIYL